MWQWIRVYLLIEAAGFLFYRRADENINLMVVILSFENEVKYR